MDIHDLSQSQAQWRSDSLGVSQHSSPGSVNCTGLRRPWLSPALTLMVINCTEDAQFGWTKQRLRDSSWLGTDSAAYPQEREKSGFLAILHTMSAFISGI